MAVTELAHGRLAYRDPVATVQLSGQLRIRPVRPLQTAAGRSSLHPGLDRLGQLRRGMRGVWPGAQWISKPASPAA